MFESLCILGRQPEIGLAELESLYGANKLKPVGNEAALLDLPTAEVSFAYLGGTMKFCKTLTELDTVNWDVVTKFLTTTVPEHAGMLPGGKLKLGLSCYGLKVSPKQVTATGLKLKSILKAGGRSSRVVPNQDLALNSAQVLHNKLTSELGWELIFVRNGNKTIVAQTIAVQDIDAYAKRDHGRPARDSKVGMLPPKLAQIIINMAAGKALPPGCGPANPVNKTVLDPFCGTGVVLIEAALMGYSAIGTDIQQKMIDYTARNVEWLTKEYGSTEFRISFEKGDATNMVWGDNPKYTFDFVASEAYLGRPFTSTPSKQILDETASDVNTITKKFLQNLAGQTKPGFRASLALPAWHVGGKIKHLPVLDHLTDMGYTRLSFVHAGGKLIYRREGQIVGRELVTLIRK